jgi:hypothetical protein
MDFSDQQQGDRVNPECRSLLYWPDIMGASPQTPGLRCALIVSKYTTLFGPELNNLSISYYYI